MTTTHKLTNQTTKPLAPPDPHMKSITHTLSPVEYEATLSMAPTTSNPST
jgi:hypothetical protein